MPENSNITCRILEKTADLWRSAIKYQLFIILGAIALLAILPLFKTKLNDTACLFNIAIFCTAAVVGFLIIRSKGSQMAALAFASALILRLFLVFVLESSTPHILEEVRVRPQLWIRHYDSILFQPDEFYYVYEGQKYTNISAMEFINSAEFSTSAYRASFPLSRFFRIFGDEFIWSRIAGGFLGAFAAALVTLAAEKLFSRNPAAIVSLFSVVAPQSAFYSVRFLKEIWIIFASSLMIYGFAIIVQNKKKFSAGLVISAAIIISLWVRFEYGLMFIAAVPFIYFFRNRNDAVKRVMAIIVTMILIVIIFACQFKQLTYKAQYLYDKYSSPEQNPAGKVEMMDKIYKSRGILRLMNIPLAILNPPPKNLHLFYTEENRLFDIILLSDIYQWWIPLPFLIIGVITIITTHKEFMIFLIIYISTIIISAMLLGGLEPNLLRYRDCLLPAAFIIIGAGIESLLKAPKDWENRVVAGVYLVFVLLALYFFVRGF